MVAVFLRGVNVGGHRRLQPTVLARDLAAYEIVNIGAAGTFVVRQPGSLARFRADLARRLPFKTEVRLCSAGDLLRAMAAAPFTNQMPGTRQVYFVSILPQAPASPFTPAFLPAAGDWFVRILGSSGQFVFGEYRRHMKTIGYLGQLDRMLGAPVTTRNWATILKVAEVLRS